MVTPSALRAEGRLPWGVREQQCQPHGLNGRPATELESEALDRSRCRKPGGGALGLYPIWLGSCDHRDTAEGWGKRGSWGWYLGKQRWTLFLSAQWGLGFKL